jgi:hypothetical protein
VVPGQHGRRSVHVCPRYQQVFECTFIIP